MKNPEFLDKKNLNISSRGMPNLGHNEIISLKTSNNAL